MIRSESGIAPESALSSVVLPEPVPPEIRMLSSAWTHSSRNSRHSWVSEPLSRRSLRSQRDLGELPDREQRSGQRQRRDHRVDAAAVRQAGVDHRRGLVDPAADLGHDLVDDPPQVVVVGEPHLGPLQPALALEPDVARTVDHDLGHAVVIEKGLDRPVARACRRRSPAPAGHGRRAKARAPASAARGCRRRPGG